MTDKPVEDDFSRYFGWREEVARKGAKEEEEAETVTDLSRRLSSVTKEKKGRRRGKKEERKEPKDNVPLNRTVDVINMGKQVETADEGLLSVRAMYEEKMVEFAERWQKVEDGQLKIKQNLVKFNNFVREKQAKVESGFARAEAEKEEQARKQEELEQLRQEKTVHEEAKTALGVAVTGKTAYVSYLEKVMGEEPEKYLDISSLIQRCQALVASRDSLVESLEKTKVATEEEARSLEKFKEQKMGQTLAYNVKLADLQQTYAGLAAHTLERKTFVQNIEEKKAEKRLVISNIKLSILNMHKYANSRAVEVPGDREEEKTPLNNIMSHIEDLEMVVTREQKSDLEQGYLDALASDKSELRVDY